jgi:nucleotide-binding universal stress UspA family protein
VDAQPLILLPLDQLASGENKIPIAIEYARLLNARLVLLHVLPDRELDPRTVLPSEASARVYLDTIAARIEAAGVPAAKVIRRGSPARAIVDEARIVGARLIILGTNAHSRLSTALGASVAEQVMRQAPCPVLTVQPSAPLGHGGYVRLRSFAEDAVRAGALVRHHRGVRTIEVARIVGSVCRAAELGADFRRPGPLKQGSIEEQRFRRVLNATQAGVTLPPIVVFQIGFGYYVEDGHHRVAAARITGQTEIDADVTEFVPIDTENATNLAALRHEFEHTTGLVELGATRPESYAVLLRAIQQFAREEGLDEMPLAARRFERVVYRPLWATIRERELSATYPGDRTADTIARVAEVHMESGLNWPEALEDVARAAVQRSALAG